MRTFEDLKEIVAVLRSDHGCPWDKKANPGESEALPAGGKRGGACGH